MTNDLDPIQCDIAAPCDSDDCECEDLAAQDYVITVIAVNGQWVEYTPAANL